MLADFLFLLVVTVALPVRAWRRFRRRAPPSLPARYIAETVTLTLALSILLRQYGVSLTMLGLAGHSPLRWLGDVAFCLLVVIGVDFVMCETTVRRLRTGGALTELKGLAADALSAKSLGRDFLLVTIIGSLWEELCFRGAVFALVPRTLIWTSSALFVSSLLFGTQHLRNGLHGMTYSALFGLMFGTLFLMSRDLWAVILAHTAGNLLAAWQWAPRIERARKQSRSRGLGFLG